MGEVARKIGKPLMPWQQHVVDVVLEVDDAGQLVYSEVGLVVPRQSGKSTLLLAKALHRSMATGFFGRRQNCVYTAQTRGDARRKWEEDFLVQVQESRLGAQVSPHLSNGNEHMRFANGSRFGIESTTEKAGHGSTIDEAYIDEAFALVDRRMEQAFRPAMITRSNKQLWWVSTGGWSDGSPYLWEKVQRGRRSESEKREKRLAYFEWSAPDDADPDDPATWWGCMPALGHQITEESIADERAAMDDADFRRAFLNQWVPKPKPKVETVIDMALWVDRGDSMSRRSGPVAFAVDTNPERSSSSIAVCGRRTDGRLHLEVVGNEPGTGWVVDRMVGLVERHSPVAVVIDPSGPAGPLIASLQEAGVTVSEVSGRELAQACAGFYDDVVEDRVRHINQAELTQALASAKKRNLLDTWAWARRDATDISPLVAVTLARHGLLTGKASEAVVHGWYVEDEEVADASDLAGV